MMAATQDLVRYPLIKSKRQAILAMLEDLQIPCTLEDLTKPTPQRTMAIYDALMTQLTSLSMSSLISEQPEFAVLDVLEHPDLHSESVGYLRFYKKLIAFMYDVGITCFSLRDIIKPEPGRLMTFLNALINFYKFRESCLEAYWQLLSQNEELLANKATLEQAAKEITEKISTIRLQRAEQEPQTEQFRQDNINMGNALRELKKKYSHISNDIDQLKDEKAALEERINNTAFLISNAKQECARLRGRIVHSPEKLQQAIVDMSNTAAQEKANLAALEKKDRELHAKIEMISIAESDVANCNRLLDELLHELKRLEQVKQQVMNERQSIERKELEIRELTAKEQQLKRQMNNTEEKMSRLKRHQMTKQTGHDDRITKLTKEYEALSAERATIQRKIDENNAKMAATDDKMIKIKTQMENEEATLQADYQKLKTKVDLYQSQLLAASS